jgi:hypothetical protein
MKFISYLECIYGSRAMLRINSTNQLVFVMDTQWVFCEIASEVLNIFVVPSIILVSRSEGKIRIYEIEREIMIRIFWYKEDVVKK